MRLMLAAEAIPVAPRMRPTISAAITRIGVSLLRSCPILIVRPPASGIRGRVCERHAARLREPHSHEHTEAEEERIDQRTRNEAAAALSSDLKAKRLSDRLNLLAVEGQQLAVTRDIVLEPSASLLRAATSLSIAEITFVGSASASRSRLTCSWAGSLGRRIGSLVQPAASSRSKRPTIAALTPMIVSASMV